MARRKRTISVDGNNHISVDEETSIRQALTMAGFETETLPPSVTSGGELISASDYDRPVPAPTMITNQTDMEKGAPTIRDKLLYYEFELISRFLSEFPGKPRTIELDDNYLLIRNFPLPDSYTQDNVHLLFLISGYYDFPPAGLYIPSKTSNRDQIAKHLGGRLMSATPSFVLEHVSTGFREQAKKLADLGWDWVCFHFKGWTWKLNTSNLLAGDSLYKLIENVFVALAGKHK